jgi:hypothetical protein
LQTKDWPGDSALLLVHGVGSYQLADYDSLLQALQLALGPRWDELAVYTVLYDDINDWFAAKTNAAGLVNRLLAYLGGRFDEPELGPVVAEGAGDVIWPVLSVNARAAIRERVLAQIRQMVLDGDRVVPSRRKQKLYVLCHSLGCFHTYEVLCAAASDPVHGLQPVSDSVRFQSVVMMASPVQLIRTVAQDIRDLIPSPLGLAILKPLAIPSQASGANGMRPSIQRLVSLTGNLDPVGGFLFRNQLSWAYMNIPGQESEIEQQQLAGIDSRTTLAGVLGGARGNRLGLPLSPNNPHDWTGYVTRNQTKVAKWLA